MLEISLRLQLLPIRGSPYSAETSTDSSSVDRLCQTTRSSLWTIRAADNESAGYGLQPCRHYCKDKVFSASASAQVFRRFTIRIPLGPTRPAPLFVIRFSRIRFP